MDFQCCLSHSKETTDVLDAADRKTDVARVAALVPFPYLREPGGGPVIHVAHRFVLSLSLPIAARSETMRSQVAAGDGGA